MTTTASPSADFDNLIQDFWTATESVRTVGDETAFCDIMDRQNTLVLQVAATPAPGVRHMADKTRVLERMMDSSEGEWTDRRVALLVASIRADAENLAKAA